MTNHKNSLEIQANHLLNVVEKELRHIKQTDQRLFGNKLTLEDIERLDENYELSERVEAFVSRFGRLQDTLGDKVLPLLLKTTGEKFGPLVDNLARAEKLGWLESSSDWMLARHLRNKMVHEYIDDPKDLLDALREGHVLLSMLEFAQKTWSRELKQRLLLSY